MIKTKIRKEWKNYLLKGSEKAKKIMIIKIKKER